MTKWEDQLETFLLDIVNPLLLVRIKSHIKEEIKNARHNGYLHAMQDMRSMGLLKTFEETIDDRITK